MKCEDRERAIEDGSRSSCTSFVAPRNPRSVEDYDICAQCGKSIWEHSAPALHPDPAIDAEVRADVRDAHAALVVAPLTARLRTLAKERAAELEETGWSPSILCYAAKAVEGDPDPDPGLRSDCPQTIPYSFLLRGYAEPAGGLPAWAQAILNEAADAIDALVRR